MNPVAAYTVFVIVVVSLMIATILHKVAQNVEGNRQLAIRYKVAVDGPVIRLQDWILQAIIIGVVSAGLLPVFFA